MRLQSTLNVKSTYMETLTSCILPFYQATQIIPAKLFENSPPCCYKLHKKPEDMQ